MVRIKNFMDNAKLNYKILRTNEETVRVEYIKNSVKQNFFAIFVVSVLCVIIEVYNIIVVLNYGKGLTTINNRIYFYFYVVLLVVAIINCFIQKMFYNNDKYIYRSQFWIVVFYMLWTAMFNSYQLFMGHGESTIVFSSALTGAMVIVNLKLRHKLGLIAGFFVGFLMINIHYMTYGNVINTTTAIMIATCATLIIYVQNINSLKNKKDIDKVNKELKNEKEQLKMSLERNAIIMNELDLYYFEYIVPKGTLILSKSFAKKADLPTIIHRPEKWLAEQAEIEKDNAVILSEMIVECVNGTKHKEIQMYLKDFRGGKALFQIKIDAQLQENGEPNSIIGTLQNIDDIRKIKEQVNRRVSEQLKGTKNYFEYLKSTQEKVLRYHHDMRHSLKLIEQLVAQGDMVALRNHTVLATEELEAIAPNIYCENDTVNLILGSFSQMAQKENVSFKHQTDIPNHLPLSSLELCTLFFNLLENALFASRVVREEEGRNIQIKSHIKS
ncbi:MAG: hypothetical protein R3Y33_07970, partial [Clostridia bacterium]